MHNFVKFKRNQWRVNENVGNFMLQQSTVWSPNNNQSLIDKAEMVQRKSVRWIENKWQHDSSPTMMMRALNLKPLESRRNISGFGVIVETQSTKKEINRLFLSYLFTLYMPYTYIEHYKRL